MIILFKKLNVFWWSLIKFGKLGRCRVLGLIVKYDCCSYRRVGVSLGLKEMSNTNLFGLGLKQLELMLTVFIR